MVLIPGPICLNCEEKKNAPYPITIDERSGYICNECYNANIWAQKEDQKIQRVRNFQSMQNLNRLLKAEK